MRRSDSAIADELARDPTSTGAESAAAARASQPTAEAKASAWDAIVGSDSLSKGMLRATAEGFWHAEQLALCKPYVEPYLAALPEIWRTRPADSAWLITNSMFPALLVSPETVDLVSGALESGRDDSLRRLLVEGRADLERALRARAVDRADQPNQATDTSSA